MSKRREKKIVKIYNWIWLRYQKVIYYGTKARQLVRLQSKLRDPQRKNRNLRPQIIIYQSERITRKMLEISIVYRVLQTFVLVFCEAALLLEEEINQKSLRQVKLNSNLTKTKKTIGEKLQSVFDNKWFYLF